MNEHLRILAVDDEEGILALYQNMLGPMGKHEALESNIKGWETKRLSEDSPHPSDCCFDLVLCRHANEAVEAVQKSIKGNMPFSLAFIDVRLPPGPNGVVAAKRIRTLDPNIIIMMVTGYSDIMPLEISRQVPPLEKLHYLQKPFYPQEIQQFALTLGAKWQSEKKLRAFQAELEAKFKERSANLERSNKELQAEIQRRMLAEKQLKMAFERFSTVMDSLDALVYVADMKTHELLFLNKYGHKIWGKIVGRTCWKVLQKDQPGPCDFCTNEKILNGNGEPTGVYHWEFQNTTNNEWYDCRDQAIEWTDGRIVRMEIATNITERKQAEEQLNVSSEKLHNLSAHLQSAREKERMIVARDIHDELGQILTTLKIEFSNLTRELLQDNEKSTVISEFIDMSIHTVKRISSDLRPSLLDNLGVMSAMKQHVKDFQNHTGIECTFTFNTENVMLDKERSIAIYRIFQESLTNVARHANATEVKATIKKEIDWLIIEIKDNGRGITGEEISSPQSLGIIGMRERAYSMAGQVRIEGDNKKGTSVKTTIPLS